MPLKPVTIASMSLVLLSACGGGSDNLDVGGGDGSGSCGSALNPAASVRLSLESFAMGEGEGLDQTLLRDLADGTQPSPDADSGDQSYGQLVHNDLLASSRDFIGNSGSDAYQSARNPYDLMARIIATDQVDNFRRGRSYISDCIDAGNAAQYSNRANDVSIQLLEVQGGETTDRFQYPTLSWVYAPDQSDKVQRVIQYQGSGFLDGVLVGTRFDSQGFRANGYNRPERVSASFTGGDDTQRLSIEQDYVDGFTDEWFRRSEEGTFAFAGEEDVDCARVVVDYPLQEARVFTSSQPANQSESDYVNSAEYCANQAKNEARTYPTVSVPRRQ